jgi:hypothetical protein
MEIVLVDRFIVPEDARVEVLKEPVLSRALYMRKRMEKGAAAS